MRNYFTFAGVDCRDFSLYINGHKTFNSPERNYSLYEVPGRNGSIAEDGKSFKNVELHYENSFIFENFDQNFSNMKNFLLSRSGYQRLTDTYHPDEYRMAIFRKAIEPAMNESNEVGAFDLVFECQPQRYLLSGEEEIVITPEDLTELGGTFQLINATQCEAMPLIKITAPTGGVIQINDVDMEIGDLPTSITSSNKMIIDSKLMDCYDERLTLNLNNYMTSTGYLFPTLKPGVNNIAFNSGITSFSITPRWFRI